MKTNKAFVLWVMTMHLGGCARITSTDLRKDREILAVHTETQKIDGDVSLQNMSWDDYVLSGTLVQEEKCFDIQRQDVRETSTSVKETEWVWADIVGGGLLSATGAALLVVSRDLSNEGDPDDPEALSEQERFTAYGAGGALGGVALLAHGLYVAGKGMDQTMGVQETTEVIDRSEPKVCGSRPIQRELALSLNGRVLHRWSAGEFRIDFKDKPDLCPVEAFGRPLDLVGSSRTLHQISVDDCALAQHVAQRVASVRLLLAEAEPDFTACASLIADARKMLVQIEEGSHFALVAAGEVTAIEASLDRRAHDVSSQLLTEFKEAFASEGPTTDVAELGRNAVNAAEFANAEPGEAFRTVYGQFMANPRLDWDAFQRLVLDDSGLTACIEGDACPGWWEQDTWRSIAKPAFATMAVRMNRAIDAVERDSKRLRKSPSTEAREKLLTEVETLRTNSQTWCSIGFDIYDLRDVCTRNGLAIDAAGAAVNAAEARIEERQIAATARAWRKQFPICQKLHSGIQDLRGLVHCDAGCQNVKDRMREDYNKLKTFRVEDARWDQSTLDAVNEECLDARCPSCPKRGENY